MSEPLRPQSAKEVPERLLLSVIECLGLLTPSKPERPYRWTFWWDIQDSLKANGVEAPEKVLRAKLAKLVKRGILDGCTCGCRGDFWVKDTAVLPLDTVPVVRRYRD